MTDTTIAIKITYDLKDDYLYSVEIKKKTYKFLLKLSLNISFTFFGTRCVILENFAINDKMFDLSDDYRSSLTVTNCKRSRTIIESKEDV